MKTEQEQIEQMITIFKNNREVCHHISCIKCKYCGDEDCMYSSCAYSLYQAGYGDVSEYKAEIERLNSHNGFLQSVISHSKDMLDEAVKQAQTDTINIIVEYCEIPNHWNELKDCKLFGGKSDDLRNFLNGIFK